MIRRSAELPARNSSTANRGPKAYKRRLAGRCYRCLGLDHQVAQRRDPVRCLRCIGVRHISRLCPSRRRQSIHSRLTFPSPDHRRPISTDLRSRLIFPPESIHIRLIFSSPPQQSTEPPRATSPTACCPLGDGECPGSRSKPLGALLSRSGVRQGHGP